MKSVKKRMSAQDRRRKQYQKEIERIRKTIVNTMKRGERYKLKLLDLESKLSEL